MSIPDPHLDPDPYLLGLPDLHPVPLVRGTDPRIWICTNKSQIRNTGKTQTFCHEYGTCSIAVAIFLFCLAAALSSMPHCSFSLAMLSLSSCACFSILAFSLANPSRSLAAASLALFASSSASAFFFRSSASSRKLAAFAFLAWCHRIKKVKETRIIISFSEMILP
jgi:hypothetical protein